MKSKTITLFFVLLSLGLTSNAQEPSLENYLLNFDYAARSDMRVRSSQLVELMKTEKVQLVDIRFEEEFKAWSMPFAISIPLPDLPKNLHKLNKEQLIVTACPKNDRAIIAMVYLKTQGYNVKYLSDGLLELANFLRGNNARDFIGKEE
jgi:rhodanese-related sulfurtransferase